MRRTFILTSALAMLMLIPITARSDQDGLSKKSEIVAIFSARPPKGAEIIRIDCDQNQARICQQQAVGCDSICKSSGADQKSCWAGCVNRYQECKMAADCQ
jgi:hypothetical protein